MSLRRAWEDEAEGWLRWLREAGDADLHWRWARPALIELLPRPGRATLDLGCGEGRLARELAALGHRVTGVDTSSTLIRHAREAGTAITYLEGDAAALPLADAVADLAVAYMSLMNMDDMPGAVREAARALEPGGRFCLAVVHPLDSAVARPWRAGDPLTISDPYFRSRPYADTFARGELKLTFRNVHHSLETYARALEDAGFVIEAIREPRIPQDADVGRYAKRWQTIPLALVVRAVKR